jgi:hypothetical protein
MHPMILVGLFQVCLFSCETELTGACEEGEKNPEVADSVCQEAGCTIKRPLKTHKNSASL